MFWAVISTLIWPWTQTSIWIVILIIIRRLVRRLAHITLLIKLTECRIIRNTYQLQQNSLVNLISPSQSGRISEIFFFCFNLIIRWNRYIVLKLILLWCWLSIYDLAFERRNFLAWFDLFFLNWRCLVLKWGMGINITAILGLQDRAIDLQMHWLFIHRQNWWNYRALVILNELVRRFSVEGQAFLFFFLN